MNEQVLKAELDAFYDTHTELFQSKIRNGILESFFEHPIDIRITFPYHSKVCEYFIPEFTHTFRDEMKITLHYNADTETYSGILSELSLTTLTDDFIRELHFLVLSFITDPPLEISNIETLTDEFERILKITECGDDYSQAVSFYNIKLDQFVEKLIYFRVSVLRHYENYNYLKLLDQQISKLKMSKIIPI